jgi:hypothetical protein
MYMHCLYSLFCQLPNCNFFTQHVIYLYGETPLLNCGPWSTLLHSYYHLLSTSIIYFPANKYLLPHDTFNPLFTANRWDWQPHCKLGQSTLVVLCARSMLLLVPSYAQIGTINKLSGAVTDLYNLYALLWPLKPWSLLTLPWFSMFCACIL